MDGTCGKHDEVKKAHKILNSVDQGKGSLVRFWSTQENNVTMATGSDFVGCFFFFNFIRIQMEVGAGLCLAVDFCEYGDEP